MLGKLPLHIGKVRKEVCSPEDLDGKKINQSGIDKILAHYGREMEMMEEAKPDIVFVEALAQKVKNPRWLLAYDRERKQKVQVSISKNRKEYYAKAKTRFLVERGCENGKFLYRWKPNLKK